MAPFRYFAPPDNQPGRIALMGLLLVFSILLTYFFRGVLGKKEVFTHYFYLPTILACLWWTRKGLYVSGFFFVLLITSPWLFSGQALTAQDIFRAGMIVLVGLVTVRLQEQVVETRVQLHSTQKQFQTLFETTGTAVVMVEDDQTISFANLDFEKLSGTALADVLNQKKFPDFVAPRDRERINGYHRLRRSPGCQAPSSYEFSFITGANAERPVAATVNLVPGTGRSLVSMTDLTLLKQSLTERQALQQRLEGVKVISGIVTVCAGCKKIRDADRQWLSMETYLNRRTEATFSHGICPDCARSLYSEFNATALPEKQTV